MDITFLRADELKKFLNVVAVSDLSEQKPNELVRLSLIRPRMCELCGSIFKIQFSKDELFTIGLSSHMDAMLDKRMIEILATITFSDKIKSALLDKDDVF
jgi:c-di-GMP-related signal transduction protein